MTDRVVITGMGAISGFGVGKEALFKGLAEGRTAFGSRAFADRRFPTLTPLYGAYIEEFSAAAFLGSRGIRTLNRETRIFASAAVMACRDAGLDPKSWARERVGIFAATMFAGLDDYVQFFTDGLAHGVDRVNPSQGPQTGFNTPASQLAIYLGAEGPNITMTSGAASGTDVLAYAAEYIREERAAVVLAGGIDTLSYVPAHALIASAESGGAQVPPRPFDLERQGPVFGEGGVVFVLEDQEHARARRAPAVAEVCGAGSAFEPAISAAALGEVAERAIGQALDAAGLGPAEVDAIVASGNGHRLGDASEAEALYKLFGGEVPVYGVKGATGECLGASGMMQAAAAWLSMSEGFIPGTPGFRTPDPALPPIRVSKQPLRTTPRRVLVHSLDGGGAAAALILSRPGSS